MTISDGEIAQVRAATDIVALISEQVALKKSGMRWSGLCPFHGEKTPSFSVNAEQGLYYCFGCRASGDAIKFVRETQHLDFRDALQYLADKAGIELHDDASSGPARKERQEFMDAMARAVEWYHDRLLNSPDAGRARQYLRSRGIDGETVRRFRLGWAPDEWDALSKSLTLSAPVLVGTGLGFVNSRGNRQDALRARVIFPIFDTAGKTIALGGRILPPGPDDVARSDGRVEPKYKNSPETAIYSKRRTLYALNFAKDDVIKSGEIIVCEGYTDVIGMFNAGLPRAVATCGTALSEEHFRTMRNFARRIVLAYDADSAGQSAAASVYQWEKKHEVDVAVVRLPRGSDPGELAQKDPDALRAAVAAAIPYLQFRLDRVLEAANMATPEGRARAAQGAVSVVAEHPSDLVRDQYLRQIADRCRVDVDQLRPLVVSAQRGALDAERSTPRFEEPAPREVSATSRPGRAALALMIHAFDSVEGRFDSSYFLDQVQKVAFEALAGGALVADVLDSLDRRDELDASNLIREISVEEISESLTGEREIAAVAAQLIRAAAQVALREVDRDLRAGLVTPDSALAVIRDVKNRLGELDGADGASAEADLRDWLASREVERVD
jgi:DNA primase